MNWTDLVQDMDQWRALVKTVMNLRVPQNAWNVFSSCTTSHLSRSISLIFCMITVLNGIVSPSICLRHQRRPAADVTFSFSSTLFPWTVLMGYTNENLEINNDNASPCFDRTE
jgi:hypothetical protein